MSPVLILRSEHAPTPTRVIAEGLSELLPASRLIAIDGAGHMGPLTHAPQFREVLLLDADQVPTRDPQEVFDWPE